MTAEKQASTMQHTPGPWRVGFTVNKGDAWKGWRETDILGAEGCFLSLHQYHTAEEADANARLIAAAPEMLAVLLTLAALPAGVEIGDTNTGHNASLQDMARALLARLEGV